MISLIPRLIERSGTGLKGQGSITSFYTVLADGDDANDPFVDTARAILDGHILLSRQQTQLGIYPAVDIPSSVSRVMSDIASEENLTAARNFRRLISLFLDNRELILMGGYVQGQDAELDAAISMWPQLVEHIRQPEFEKADYASSVAQLVALAGS